jgi:ubiquinone/menaquinone biosynthesis C-methylase UbiE
MGTESNLSNQFPSKDEISKGYDKLPEELFMPKKFHKKCIKILHKNIINNEIVADFGCGHGNLLELLADSYNKKKLVACDLSFKLCENAKNKAPHADVRVADLEDLPFNDNSIDCGFATEVLEHMETPVRALKEIHRVLKPNSKLLISLPNKDWFRFDEYLGKREKFQPVDDKFYTVLEMEEFLTKAGYKVIKIRGGENLYFGGGLPRLLEKIALFLYPRLNRKMKRMIIVSEVVKR